MITEITVRGIKLTDYTTITNLIGELGYPSTLEKVSDRLNRITKDNNYQTLVAEINGEVVGFIGLCKLLAYEGCGCYIRIISLAVNEQYRNHGIGTKLINSAEEWASRQGASGIVIDSGINRKEAHAFYTNRGYALKDYGFAKLL